MLKHKLHSLACLPGLDHAHGHTRKNNFKYFRVWALPTELYTVRHSGQPVVESRPPSSRLSGTGTTQRRLRVLPGSHQRGETYARGNRELERGRRVRLSFRKSLFPPAVPSHCSPSAPGLSHLFTMSPTTVRTLLALSLALFALSPGVTGRQNFIYPCILSHWVLSSVCKMNIL